METIADQEFAFSYRGKDWVLRPTEHALMKFEEASAGAIEEKDGQRKVLPGRFRACMHVMLCESIFNGSGTVTPDDLKTWGPKVVQDLFEKASVMCGLRESVEESRKKAREQAKN